MSIVFPLTPLWFKKRRVFRSKAYFETRVQEAIDRELPGASRVSAEIARDGAFSKPELHLFGEVEDPYLIRRAAAVADAVGQGTVDVVIDVLVTIERPSDN